jgi:hypothetical protein
VDTEEVGEGDAVVAGGDPDRVLHGGDVAENLDGDPVAGIIPSGEGDLGLYEPLGGGDETLDHRGADGFRSEQEPGQPLEADVAGPGPVEAGDRILGIGEVSRDVGGNEEIPAREWVGQVGVVIATLPVAPTHTFELGRPSLSDA